MYVFISSERKNLSSEDNKIRTKSLEIALKSLNFRFRECLGMYEGDLENSFRVGVDGLDDVRELLDVSSEFDQDCIMVVDGLDDAWLFYPNGDRISLGQFIMVKNVNGLENWSKVWGQYFTVR